MKRQAREKNEQLLWVLPASWRSENTKHQSRCSLRFSVRIGRHSAAQPEARRTSSDSQVAIATSSQRHSVARIVWHGAKQDRPTESINLNRKCSGLFPGLFPYPDFPLASVSEAPIIKKTAAFTGSSHDPGGGLPCAALRRRVCPPACLSLA